MSNWPHAPLHMLESSGIYMVTCGTYQKVHHFRSDDRLELVHDTLLHLAKEAGWILHAWAVFSNHYHFIAQSPKDATNLPLWLGKLHHSTAVKVNREDNTPKRRVWYQYWDSYITIHTSYLARLHYVHQNAVKHGLVPKASLYHWCSAAAFEQTAEKSFVKTVYSFKLDKVNVFDPF